MCGCLPALYVRCWMQIGKKKLQYWVRRLIFLDNFIYSYLKNTSNRKTHTNIRIQINNIK